MVAQERQRAPLRGGGVGLGVESRDAGEGVHREQKGLQVVVAGHIKKYTPGIYLGYLIGWDHRAAMRVDN